MKLRARIGFATVIVFLGLAAYFLIGRATCVDNSVLNLEMVAMPDFVNSVWPLPQSKISSICYFKSFNNGLANVQQRGISVEIHPISIIDFETPQQSSYLIPPFKDRVSLYIDDVLISDKSRIVFDNLLGIAIVQNGEEHLIPDLSEKYIFSWTPCLMPGNHVAKIKINTKSGEILEYEWNFLIW